MKHLTLSACTIFLLLFSGVSHAADSALMKQANQFFKPLPKVMESAQNSITPAKVRLGKMLFWLFRLFNGDPPTYSSDASDFFAGSPPLWKRGVRGDFIIIKRYLSYSF